ncbi:hypothetical protein C2G38_2040954 [Gigaspora rosea]|uniref:Zn(2)-C6 fungal-type domain-containing protein n=1 Tax=Gigaspora rosea TaxID=44941 RepID=A0A397UVR7_9GLOM|nr:hypothetical protein C2G38_2040954 [Gigaspora rosea]CAG8610776.1 13128_t:CDS:1 [Gigaspora rosea]
MPISAEFNNNNSTPLQASTPSNGISPTRCRGNYVKAACESCAKSKVKCTGGTPCERCSSKPDQCTYKPHKKRGPRSKSCDGRQDNLRSSLRRSRSCDNRRRSNCHFATTKAEDNNNALGIFQDALQLPNNNFPFNFSSRLGHSNSVLLDTNIFLTLAQPEMLQNQQDNSQLDLDSIMSLSPQSDGWLTPESFHSSQGDGRLTPGSQSDGWLTPGSQNDNWLTPGSQNDGWLTPESQNNGWLTPGSQNNGWLTPTGSFENNYNFETYSPQSDDW